jgi:hypothetical protein
MEQPSEFTAEAIQSWTRPIVLLPIFMLLSLVGGLFPSFSILANLYVLLIGGTMMWLGLSGRVPKRAAPTGLARGTAWWLLPSLFLAIVELTNFVLGSSYPHPTLSLLMDPLLDGYLARAAVYFGWLSAFWGLVRR